MDVSDVRRRLRGAMEAARARAAERRARNDEATRAYEPFLVSVAIPAFHTLAQALTGEGHRFKVLTPGEAVRLTPEFSAEDYVELSLDTTGDRPVLMLRTARGRGRRAVATESVVFDRRSISELTEDDVVGVVLDALTPFLER